jgi:L-2-hydroxyglutarate oxidase LhgO
MSLVADTGIVVVGAGVVGLAVAARLAPTNPDLIVLERQPKYGQETSSRNSEVIHGGMYYPPGSLKARLCVEGNRRMYALCAQHEVPHRRLGKVITATVPGELPELDRVEALGAQNGVLLERLSAAQTNALEPHVRTVGALLSPNTGVVSAHDLMDHFARVARQAGATIQTRAEVVGIEKRDREYRLTVRGTDGLESFTAERVVNAAGLGSDTVAALAGIDVDAAGYRLHYWKGSYFALASARPGLVSRLIYPVPDRVSLGVHALLDLGGRLRFGPDAEARADRALDYRVEDGRRAAFAESVRRLIPSVTADELVPDISGIRPKLQAPGEPPRDFVIAEESARGLPGFVNLVGIDSPGLTASPAIAEEVARLLGE